jgi:mono/diheme cytochrome c family protein
MRKVLLMIATLAAVGLFVGSAFAEPDGKALYSAKCAMCHGADGVAKSMWAKTGVHNLNDAAWQKSKSDADITKVIVDGSADKKMPGYKDKMTAEEIAAIVKHVRALAPAPAK